jgi:hypothetical protein
MQTSSGRSSSSRNPQSKTRFPLSLMSCINSLGSLQAVLNQEGRHLDVVVGFRLL